MTDDMATGLPAEEGRTADEKTMQDSERDTGDGDPDTWQERIVEWRYSSNSIPKRIGGFWIKAGIEGGIVVGLPVGLFVLAATTLANVQFSVLSVVQVQGSSVLTTWILLTVFGWLTLRCLLTDGLQVVRQPE